MWRMYYCYPKWTGVWQVCSCMWQVSFLWTIKREPPSYLFGTIHVPYSRVWEFIPENMKTAFVRADNIFFELDLSDTHTVSTLASCQLLPSNETLSTLLPPRMYDRLRRHLDFVRTTMPSWLTADQKGRGLYADYLFNAITGNWQRKRPVWVMLMVNTISTINLHWILAFYSIYFTSSDWSR